MKKKCLYSVLVIGLCLLFFSCSGMSSRSKIDIGGNIYYETGTYGQVNYIEFNVVGGTGNYRVYYSRSIDDWDYAWSGRTYVGTAEEGYNYTLDIDGYVSTGWYYYIWAVDDNGDSGGSRWHP